MNLELIAVVIGVFVFIGIFSGACAICTRVLNLRERVGGIPSEDPAATLRWAEYGERIVRFFRPMGEMIPRSPEEMSRLEQRIVQAGIRQRDSAILFVGTQAGTVLICFIAFGMVRAVSSHFFLHLVLSLFMGVFLPDVVLARMIARRKERIQLGLPDALDLTVICVEAGLGLDQSLMRIGQELRRSHPDLSDELRLTNIEINMGRGRADALRNLSRRTGVDDLKALCAVLIQTDRFGTSVGQALRVYSDSLRTRRRQRAEEMAAKLPVKMTPPLVLFIFPAVFVVIVGPAVIAIFRDLLPTLMAH